MRRLAFAGMIALGAAGISLADSTVVWNEISYHPERDEARLEWVELYNQMAVDMDLSGWYLDGGIRYVFPEGTIVPGSGFLVVAVEPAALSGLGISCPVLGPFSGRLDNSGERIEIRNNDGRVMDWVRYRDSGSWPTEADGSGATLAKRDPDLSSPPARNWTASAEIGGTPGAHNFPSAAGLGRYPAGLVAYWNFDQAAGQLIDSLGGNHGTAGAGATRVAGFVGTGAVAFDNTLDAYVAVGTGIGDAFSMTEGIAVEALVRSEWSLLESDPDAIFRKEDGPWRISLALQADGVASNRDVPIDPPAQPVLSFGINVGGAYSELDMPLDGREGRPAVAGVLDGRPHHVVATYDAASGLKAIYFDGALAFRHSFPPGTAMASGGTTTAYIGNMSGRRQAFAGTIDEVAIYRRALSAEEVSAHFANAAAGRNYFERAAIETPKASLRFNEYSAAGAFWLEIANPGSSPALLEGVAIALRGSGSSAPPEFVFPGGELAPGAFLVLSDAQLGFRPTLGQKLFLYAKGRRSSVDGMHLASAREARFPDGTGPWLRPARETPGAPNDVRLRDEIVVNEILYHDRPVWEGSTARRSPVAWIELYNRTDRAVDLTGWRLTDAVEYRFEPGTILGPGEYLVVAADKDLLRTLHPGVRIVGNVQGRLSRKEDRLLLLDADGNPADDVHYYDSGRWPSTADGRGSSLELRDPRADNSKAEAWAASDESGKAGWKTYSYSGIAATGVGPTRWNEFVVGLLDEGEALIDDLSVVEAPSGAAVEFLQNGSFEDGARAWRFLGNHRESRVVPNPEGPGNVLHLVATGPTEHMHNHLETTFAGGRRVTNGREYRISFRAKWLAGSNQLHTRLYFNRLPKTTLLEVPRTAGTPGARNSRYEGNIGPTFDRFEHAPIVPQAGEVIAVRARASDPDGVAAMTLSWNANATGWHEDPMRWDEAEGVHRAEIPGQPAAATIQFYVEARDRAGATSTFPAGGRDSRALIRVQDGQSALGRLHNLRIIMLREDADFLHERTNVMSNEWLPSTVVYDERAVFYDVGVRLKGSERGRPIDGRVGFHVRFDPENLFRGVHRTVHVDRSGGWKFGGPNGQDEIIIKHIINHAGGIPGMYDDMIRVIAPRSAQTGTALLLMAAYTDVYLDSRFEDGSDGSLHKMELIYYPTTTVDGNPESLKLPQPDEVTGTDLQDLGNDKENYRWTFLVENNRNLDDYSGIIALAKACGAASQQLDAATRAVMDVDQWMRAFTIISLCGVTDTYTQGNNHNNLFYRRPSDGKMLAFPWDLDFSWVRATTSPLWGDQNLARVISLPPNRRLFYGHLLDIIETTYNRQYLAPWIAHYGSLANYDYSSIATYVDQRRSYVLANIPARVPFAITTNGGAEFSVDAVDCTLEGTAWFDVRDIVVAGREEPLALVWTAADKWRARVSLDYGRNDLDLLAFDRQARLVGSDGIAVTSTVGSPAPRLAALEPALGLPGDWVVLAGANFEEGVKVFFGSAEAAAIERTSAHLLRAAVPPLEPGAVAVAVQNPDGRRSSSLAFTVLPTAVFIRGDASMDGSVNVSDAVRVIFHLFRGAALPCEDAADATDDERIDLSDVLRLLDHLFRAGPPLPAPYPLPGPDPTGPAFLGCG